MTRHERPVRFDDVDAAQIVFFAKFFSYCHEAMEAFFAPLDGGYVHLILQRKIGMPAVHVEADFRMPLRYGDLVRIDVAVAHVGSTSFTLVYDIYRGSDNARAATIRHVCVATDLVQLKKVPIPDDVRALLAGHAPSG